MSDPIEDFEVEALEAAGLEIEVLPEDREALEEALNGCLEIFSAPGEADPERVLVVIETLEDVHPYFPDTKISDQIGEVIELLHEICAETVLGFEDAQSGKHIVETLAGVLGIELLHPEIQSTGRETFDETN